MKFEDVKIGNLLRVINGRVSLSALGEDKRGTYIISDYDLRVELPINSIILVIDKIDGPMKIRNKNLPDGFLLSQNREAKNFIVLFDNKKHVLTCGTQHEFENYTSQRYYSVLHNFMIVEVTCTDEN
jgi:hypothetical protein